MTATEKAAKINLSYFFKKWKYELLAGSLIQHLFVGIFLQDLDFYTRVVWPLNMVILGIASVGVYIGKENWKHEVRNVLFALVVLLPIGISFVGTYPIFMEIISVTYVFFFAFIFWEILTFLIRPNYINADVISASACGYFLLIEINVFLNQTIFYQYPDAFKGIDTSSSAATFMDMVYFCSITLTSIGFGDITPSIHQTKLITSIFGIAGQFYIIILVGILISKFSSKDTAA